MVLLVQCQQSNTLFLLHQIPQSNFLNPAVQSQCNWFIGFPGLTSVHASYSNTAFTYNDLAGTSTWNLEGVLEQMHPVDLVSGEANLYLLALGYKHRGVYFTFHIADKTHLFQTVPRNMAGIIVQGNAPVVGEHLRFNAFRPAAFYSREYALGISRAVNPYWSAGARARLLFGKASLYPTRSSISTFTGASAFNLLLDADYTMNSSFPVTILDDGDGNITDITLNGIDYMQLLLNRGNPGVAFDLGAIYRPSEQITLSASLLDLGFIRWRTDLNQVNTTGHFIFEGHDEPADLVSTNFLVFMIDSLINSFHHTVSQLPYNTFLPVQLFLGGSYRIREHLTAGAVSHTVWFHSKMHSSLTLSATTHLSNRFLATVSWSYLNNSIMNPGAAVAYYGKGFQFHVVSDNLLGFFFPFDTRTVNLRMGMNLMLGCPRDKKEKLPAETYGHHPRGGECAWSEYRKNRKKALKRASRHLNRE